MNNLDPEVAEKPDELVVYGGIGRAARDWESFRPDRRVAAQARSRRNPAGPVRQAGRRLPHPRRRAARADRQLESGAALGDLDHFNELDRKGLMMYGQMTAGSWIYIGSQGIVQGTYETFVEVGRQHYGGDLAGRWILPPASAAWAARSRWRRRWPAPRARRRMPPSRIEMRLQTGYLDSQATDLDEALRSSTLSSATKKPISVGLLGNAAEVFPELLRRGVRPDVVTDQTSAHDPLNGYLPKGWTSPMGAARNDPKASIPLAQDSMAEHVRAMLDFTRWASRRSTTATTSARWRKEEGVDECLRFPGLRAGLHPAAVLPWHRPVPLGGAVGRSRGHLQDGCQGEGIDAGRQAPAQLARHGARADSFQGLPARICWVGLGDRHRLGLAFNEMVANGELKAPIVIGRDHLDSGSVASPNRETEAMRDGSDAVSDWPLLNALLNTAIGRHLGFAASRRRRRHRLFAARRHGRRRRRHGRSRPAPRPRALERSRHRRDAPRRCRLRHRDRLRAREGARPAGIVK